MAMNRTSFYNSFSKLLILICLLFTSNGYSAGSVEELSAIIQKRVNDTTEGQTRYVIFDLFSYFETADTITKNKIFHAYNNIFKRDGGFTAILKIAVALKENRVGALLEEYGYPAPMAYSGDQKLPADNSYGRQYPSAEEALRAQRDIKNPLQYNEAKPAAAAYGYDRWQETADERLARELQEEEAQRRERLRLQNEADEAYVRQIEAEDARARAPMPPHAAPPIGRDRENPADMRERAEEQQRPDRQQAYEIFLRGRYFNNAEAPILHNPPHAAPPIEIAAANETPEARRNRLYFEAGEACKQFTQRFKRAPNKEETVNAIMAYSNIEKAEAEGVYYNLINLNSVK